MSFLIHFLLKNWIAIFSFLLSAYAVWRTRKRITVTWSENIVEEPIGTTFTFDVDHEIVAYNQTYVANISVVNPSPVDIGYFDLRVFNPDTNINVEFLTKRTFPLYVPDKNAYQFYKEGKRYSQLDIPDRKFGVFKANTFTRLDIVTVFDTLVSENQDMNRIAISFKIAKAAMFKKDIYALTNRKKYHYYQFIYDISGWKKRRKQQRLERQAEN